ncbi:MAG: hypothetical protein LBD57_04525 [Endomicrobium sp.]|jgi:hypothetical protein|uniref:hypothetical protein n=1 Tax=Candidatus Endomicrobiellum cubanum TaxID=3242325 RepID=UPI00282E4847|nr:hypothetical protein [Endomicrobium sp.]
MWDGEERRGDNRILLDMASRMGALETNMGHTKDGIEKIDSKLENMLKSAVDRDATVGRLTVAIETLGDRVLEQEDKLDEHVKNDISIVSWLSNKVIYIIILVMGMIGAAFVNQYLIPKVMGIFGSKEEQEIVQLTKMPTRPLSFGNETTSIENINEEKFNLRKEEIEDEETL